MDDILASIRRIIADDDALPLSRSARAAAAQPAPPPPPPAASSADALLGLGQRLFRGGEAASAPERPAATAFRPPAPRPVPAPAPEAPKFEAPKFETAKFEAPKSEPPKSEPTKSEALRAPALKLRDFAPVEPLNLRPAPVDSAARPAEAPEAVAKSVEAAPGVDPAQTLEEAVAEAVAMTTAPAQAVVEAPAPEPAAPPKAVQQQPAEAPKGEEGQGASVVPLNPTVSSLAEARLKAAPAAQRAPVAPPPVPAASSETPADRPSAKRVAAPPPADPVAIREAEPPLLSSASGARIGASFEALAESLMLRDPEMIERLAREMLRPMLKSWLDDNLPVVVERLVRAEIERIARGRP
ncbi:PopZ family protein [Rhodoblastus sp.]|uniref:PopZ family protein n=1 Tax=Rhodoblastus sp. TaxID=1962975 RepID=UPI0035B101F3